MEEFTKKINELKDIIENKKFKDKLKCYEELSEFLSWFIYDKEILCLYDDRLPDTMDKFQEYLGITETEMDKYYENKENEENKNGKIYRFL